MPKAAEAFRTISEVADTLDVPKHVLRFWELRFPQIKPMKRGGGRRYYRPTDVELLRGIRHLLHAEGYTIKGVQKILREHGIEQVKAAGRRALSAGNSVHPPLSDASLTTPAAAPAAPEKPARKGRAAASSSAKPSEATSEAGAPNRKFLERLLDELVACRAILAAPDQPATTGEARRGASS
jgi:DNA-binding transcriptional MerR regulator